MDVNCSDDLSLADAFFPAADTGQVIADWVTLASNPACGHFFAKNPWNPAARFFDGPMAPCAPLSGAGLATLTVGSAASPVQNQIILTVCDQDPTGGSSGTGILGTYAITAQ